MVMKKIILLATFLVFALFSVMLVAQNTQIYWNENYDYPEPNIMVTDIKISYYYGIGESYYVPAEEMLSPITSQDYLSRYLTVLHNSDGESALLADQFTGSVAQFATVVKDLRNEAQAQNTLVVSSGDNFLAGVQYAASEGVLDARALNLIGYDLAAIGNHEFDFGQTGFKRFVDEANFPLVSSNLMIDADSELYPYVDNKIFRATVVDRAGRNIGIVGATTDSLKYISSPGESVRAETVKEYLQGAVDSLRNRGLNVIIALTHLQDIEEEKKLAEMIDGVDVFIAGGGDDLIGNDNNEYIVRTDRDGNEVVDTPKGSYPYETTSLSGEPTFVVSVMGGYDYVGRLTILFDANGIASNVNYLKSGPVPVTLDTPADSAVQTQVVEVAERNIEGLKTDVIGRTETGLDGTKALVRTQETAMGNAVCDGYIYVAKKSYEGNVDFAFTNGGGIRNSVVIQAGSDITKYDVLEILPFSNYLTVVKGLSLQDVKDMFERSFESLPNAGGQYLQVSKEIKVVYDTSKEVGNRVVSITILNYRDLGDVTIYSDGAFIGSELTFNAVTNSFTAAGGDNYPMLASIPQSKKDNLGYSYEQGFEIYVKEMSPINTEIEGRLVDING
jgi:5'-nucleotidase